jgi:hypothetical protein
MTDLAPPGSSNISRRPRACLRASTPVDPGRIGSTGPGSVRISGSSRARGHDGVVRAYVTAVRRARQCRPDPPHVDGGDRATASLGEVACARGYA